MARLPNNVTPSLFFPQTYVAHDPRGHAWFVRKAGRDWRAQPAPNNPARALGTVIDGTSLTAVATAIANRRPAQVVAPF